MCRVDVAETTQEHVPRHVIEHWEALYVKCAAHVPFLHSCSVTLTYISSFTMETYQKKRKQYYG